MRRDNLQFELAFYGRALDSAGILYYRPKETALRYPDVLYFCMYACNLLVHKKLTLSGARALQASMRHSAEEWLQIVNWEETRPYTPPCKVTAYRGYVRSAMTSTLLLKPSLPFRYGYMGFGFFSNRKHFDRCACGSVFGLMETLYRVNTGEPGDEMMLDRRKASPEQARALECLFGAASAISGLLLGSELNRGNWRAVAGTLYKELSGDDAELLAALCGASAPEGALRVISALRDGSLLTPPADAGPAEGEDIPIELD